MSNHLSGGSRKERDYPYTDPNFPSGWSLNHDSIRNHEQFFSLCCYKAILGFDKSRLPKSPCSPNCLLYGGRTVSYHARPVCKATFTSPSTRQENATGRAGRAPHGSPPSGRSLSSERPVPVPGQTVLQPPNVGTVHLDLACPNEPLGLEQVAQGC